ncbi:MAG: YARHG domain-containing protein, partial [Lachnospiraceae bacterium]|nr:YARHG domain-containing protein [Lachnospiraceae bacterium]
EADDHMFNGKTIKIKSTTILTVILILVMSCLVNISCGRKDEAEEPGVSDKEDVSESAKDDEKADDEDPGEDDKADADENSAEDSGENTVGEEDDNSDKATLSFADAFTEGDVHNNGDYFVTVGNKVYLRNISPDSMEEGAIFGEFLQYEKKPVECALICYDLDTCKWEETGRIKGTGKLYACPDGFYIEENDTDSPDNCRTFLYDPATGESGEYCSGTPLGVSESGKLLAVEQYAGQKMMTVLIKDGKEAASFGGDNVYYEFCGFAGEDLISMKHTEDGQYVLCSMDESGNITELGTIECDGYGDPEVKQFGSFKGDVYVNIGYFEGSGHYLSGWDTFKAVPGVKDSLEKVSDESDHQENDGEGPENAVPRFYFDETQTLGFSMHLPYQAYMGEDDQNRNDLCYYNDIFEECPLVVDFIKNDLGDPCQIIQDITSASDTIFVIYADAEPDSEYDIGWRQGYRRTGWHICAIPYGPGREDENGLAGDILYFTDPDSEESGGFSDNMYKDGASSGNEKNTGDIHDSASKGVDVSNNVSDSELKRIEKKLNSIGYYGFLQSLYSDPKDIDWNLVFYIGAGFDQGSPSNKIKEAYLKETGDDEIYTDLTTLSGKDVRDYVKATTGYDLSQMRHPLEDWVYLKDQDLYLYQHGDTNKSNVDLTAVHLENGEYTATYDTWDGETCCVTFTEKGDTIRFISNLLKRSVTGAEEDKEKAESRSTDGMVIPYSDKRKLTEKDLKGLSSGQLRIARNEIYARHGRKFSDKELQEHFDGMEWYTPKYDAAEFDKGLLNDNEIYNLNFISKYEKSAGQ